MANTNSANFVSASSQYFSITDGSQTGLDLTGDFTIEMWVKWDSLPATGKDTGLARKWGSIGNRAYIFSLRDTSGTPALFSALSNNGTNVTTGSVNFTPSLDTWYHIAMTYSTGGTVKFYVNGSQQGGDQGSQVTSINNNSEPFLIANPDGGVDFFDGRIDDYRVWSIEKSQTQVNDNKSIELVGNEAGLEAYWKFTDVNDNTTGAQEHNNDLINNNGITFPADPAFVEAVVGGNMTLNTSYWGA